MIYLVDDFVETYEWFGDQTFVPASACVVLLERFFPRARLAPMQLITSILRRTHFLPEEQYPGYS